MLPHEDKDFEEEFYFKRAGRLYKKYSEVVGGKAFNGDPLPDWKEFSADPAKQKQVAGWIAAAKEK